MADESRLNRIEGKLDSVVKESSELRGEIRQFIVSQTGYTAAVSAKAASVHDALDSHKSDPDAHGAGLRREIDGKMIGWATVGATILASFGGIIGAAMHKLWNHAP